ncbi:MAG: hypothetical protein NWP47_00730, partial [Rickettsiaceae bacterium]|nr:hypothetical protein [Rickettsiaceae bacterium]
MIVTPRIAVFGCGYWGSNHVRTLAEIGALACVVDVNADAARMAAEKCKSVAMTVDEALNDPSIDAIP